MAMNRADYIEQGRTAGLLGVPAGTNADANTWQKRAWMEGYEGATMFALGRDSRLNNPTAHDASYTDSDRAMFMAGWNSVQAPVVQDSTSQTSDSKEGAFEVPMAPVRPSQGKTTFGRPNPDYVSLEMRASDVQRRIDTVTGATTGRTSSLEAALTPIPVTLARLNKTMREAANVLQDMGNRLRSRVPAAVAEHIRVLEEQAKKETNEARATRLLIKIGKITSKYASRGMQV